MTRPDWTRSAHHRNDELFVRIESQLFHDLHVAHFDDASRPRDAPVSA